MALDAFILAQLDPKPSRPEAIRILLKEALAARGATSATDNHAELTTTIEALETDLAMPAGGEQNPASALHTMDRAIAENELVGLRHKRKRIRKAKPR